MAGVARGAASGVEEVEVFEGVEEVEFEPPEMGVEVVLGALVVEELDEDSEVVVVVPVPDGWLIGPPPPVVDAVLVDEAEDAGTLHLMSV
jgi:hypothetical protein